MYRSRYSRRTYKRLSAVLTYGLVPILALSALVGRPDLGFVFGAGWVVGALAVSALILGLEQAGKPY